MVEFSHKLESYKKYWVCRCECGTIRAVPQGNLRNGHSKSCGCLNGELTKARFSTHKMYGTPTYKSWISMKDRCNNANNKNYHHYGGRGITICERWSDSFQNFFNDMGEKPKRLTLERVRNDGNYEPSNCKWATTKEQSRNRRNNHWITYEGETKPMIVWAEQLGIKYKALDKRIRDGWSIERALTTPVKTIKRKT